ncbi:ABC transporter substrate-binding protein [Sedimentibacter sp. MB31-C6]|uniref:ABC transporter substrate-binding protein n=1 Tax=Sedimentibacter sp. MB31-C6 TaxID=3109366 RepID=UPI002DDD9E95|nr:ABC transporter substrate-binding protein [Sedimentibacter sp. MB36-C1]WSI04465.1 ABC transporter substrate-binding protein [Sedimentibacter sp. MB36-C1]
MKKYVIILTVLIISAFLLSNINNLFSNAHEKKTKIYKIGVLTFIESRLDKVEGMREGLKKYGLYEEDVEIIIKNANENLDDLERMAKELVDEKVDVIVPLGIDETTAAKKVTQDSQTPVAFIGVACTVGLGFVEDRISPACNLTGIDSYYVQLSGKRIEFLKRLVPSVKKVLVLYNPKNMPIDASIEYLYDAADIYNVELDIIPVTEESEIFSILNEKSKSTDGVMLMCSLLFNSVIEEIIDITIENKLPLIAVSNKHVQKGALAFYGGTNYNEGIQAARIVVNILKGQDPEIIPIESPEKLELYVNVDTAKKIGVDIKASEMPYVDHFIYQ